MPAFVPDTELEYERLATRFVPGAGFEMDEAYRRAHLPLVAPDHPRVIRADAARGYRMGRHETIWSLVIPIPWDSLAGWPAFGAMQADLRGGALAEKIDWSTFERRRNVLHATIAGQLARGAAPDLGAERRAILRTTGGFSIRLHGIFSGNINLGRLYLKLYPEVIAGENAILRVQSRLGLAPSRLYVVGLHNLRDDLDAPQAAWLAGFIAEQRERDPLEIRIESLHLLGARDDLALDSEVAQVLDLR